MPVDRAGRPHCDEGREGIRKESVSEESKET